MYALIIVIHVVACFILIAAILFQSGRGAGISDLFGGGSSQTIFGTRASTFLTRTTTVAAIVFLLTCISLTIFSARRGRSLLAGKKEISEELLSDSSPAKEIVEEEDKDRDKDRDKENGEPADSELPEQIPQEGEN